MTPQRQPLAAAKAMGALRVPPVDPPVAAGGPTALDRRRIERALPRRSRYKYVHPRLEADEGGWRIVSPNCSRNVDPQGGEIPVARLLPLAEGGWALQARVHAEGVWQTRYTAAHLPPLLDRLVRDEQREFWV